MSEKVKYYQSLQNNGVSKTQTTVSQVRLNRMQFIACMLTQVSLPHFITESCYVMMQITGRIFYRRYRRMKCHFGHIIRLFITSNTDVKKRRIVLPVFNSAV